MTLSSVYAQKMAHATNSPRKSSALETFIPSVVHARDPTTQHPVEKWLKATITAKTDQVLAGMAAALLTMKKPNKIVPISMLAVSPTFPDQSRDTGTISSSNPCACNDDIRCIK
jgi:hypothetical protein